MQNPLFEDITGLTSLVRLNMFSTQKKTLEFAINMTYKDYIKSEEWFNIKIDLLQKRGCKCEVCNKKRRATSLQIHHKHYKNLFKEEPEDLIILCGKCHMKAHGLIKPKKKVYKKKKKKQPTINDVIKRYNKGKFKTSASFEKAYRKFI